MNHKEHIMTATKLTFKPNVGRWGAVNFNPLLVFP